MVRPDRDSRPDYDRPLAAPALVGDQGRKWSYHGQPDLQSGQKSAILTDFRSFVRNFLLPHYLDFSFII